LKWFRHMAQSGNDEKLSEMISTFGLEGYGFWWRLLEIIAEQMDESDKCDATHSLIQWSRLLYCHHHKTSKMFAYIAEVELAYLFVDELTRVVTPLVTTPLTHRLPPPSKQGVTQKNGQSKIRVMIPNLLKYRDEYTKKLRQKTDV